MTSRDLSAKISLLKHYLLIATRYKKVSVTELLRNDEVRLAAERALFLVTQAAIDLAEAYIRLRKYRAPSSMHESFYILHEHNIIDQDLLDSMLAMVGFRNVLTHGYTKIDYKIVVEVLRDRLGDIKSLVNALKQ